MKKFLTIIIVLVVVGVLGSLYLMKGSIPLETLQSKYTNEYSKFIDIDGLSVHYRDEGAGLPIVLIHGTGASLQTFDQWTDTLKNYYRVIRMDIPGFGLTGSRADHDYSIDAYVKFINDFTKKIGVSNFILGGNSLGGQIAWIYAYHHPENVKALLLLDPGGSPVKKMDIPFLSAFNLARIPILSNLMADIDPKFTIEKTLKDAYEKDELVTKEKVQMYYDMAMREGNRRAFIQRVQQIKNDPTLDPGKVKTPTLIMWGKEDAILLIDQLEGFKNMENMEYIVYPGVGHTPQDEVAVESVHDAMKFIQGVVAPKDSVSFSN